MNQRDTDPMDTRPAPMSRPQATTNPMPPQTPPGPHGAPQMPAAPPHLTARQAKLKEVSELLTKFGVVMLATVSDDGGIRARPMVVNDPTEVPDHDIWFVTSVDSPKIAETQRTHQVGISAYAHSKYLSISGKATLVQDRDLVERLWKDSWKPWFPGGKDDPKIGFLMIDVDRADWFDPEGGYPRILFEQVKAAITGQPMTDALPPVKHLS